MEAIRSNFREMLSDYRTEEASIPKYNYGSLFADLIIMEYSELTDPNTWLSNSNELKLAFDDIFSSFSTTNQVQLYRGTDYEDYINLSVGDIIDYKDRYVSWSEELNTAERFTSESAPLILSISAQLRTLVIFDESASSEKEHITKGGKFRVISVTIDDGKHVYELEVI